MAVSLNKPVVCPVLIGRASDLAILAQFFISQAAKQPVLLIVEDLHWCDDTSLEFLLYLARRCTRQPILMILTYRNDEDHASLRHCLAQLERERLAQELVLARLS